MEINNLSNALKYKILAIVAIVITLSLGFYMHEDKINITLHLDQNVEEIVSKANTVEEFLQEQEIPISEEGYINVSLDKQLENDMLIIIKSAKSYTVLASDVEHDVVSIYNTVEEVLSDAGIVINERDYTVPGLKEEISSGDEIKVFTVEEVIEITEESIPFENVTRKNPKIDLGVTKTIQNGKEGLKEVETMSKFINGELIKKEVLEERIVSEPINNVVERGTKDIVLTSRGDTNYKKAMVMSATAYDLSFESCGKNPGDKYYGITASGTQARPGVVAVDPRVIPLGTKLYIEGLNGASDYGFAVAEDTGGAIKGEKIDLFFHSATDVKNFGRKKVKVYILD